MLLLRLPSFRVLNFGTFLVFNDVRLHNVRGKAGYNFFKPVKKTSLPTDVRKGVSHSYLSQILQKCDSLASQIEAFDSCLKLPEEDISHRQAVCETLTKAMKAHFPQSSFVLIGSSVTGLGTKGCDVDLSFQFNSCNQNDPSFSSEVVLSREIEAGKVPASVIPSLPSKQQLRFIRKALSDCGLIDISSPIVPGKCPILSFSYSNLTCDLAVNNIPALRGTLFMLLCSKLDKRVAPLFRIISYWGKRSKFVGGPSKFKSYGIFLLLMYFLQTRMPPVLPPVQMMLEKTDILKNTDSWSCDISKYLEQFDVSKNSQSLEELLKEFFFFYGNFDFSTVISPFSSQLIDRSLFHTPNESKEDAFILSSVSIQDPLDLSWNVTSGVTWKYCKLFMRGLLSACILYQGDQFEPSADRTKGLLSLFDALKENDSTMLKNKSVMFKVPLFVPTEEISKVPEQYLKIAAQNIMKVFQYCLNFDCTKLETFDPEVNTSSQSKFLLSRFQCATSPAWLNRSNFYKFSLNESELDSLQNEHNISLIMSEDRNNPENEKSNFQFICECLCFYELETVKILVHLEALSGDVFNPKLALFLKEYVPKHYVKMFIR